MYQGNLQLRPHELHFLKELSEEHTTLNLETELILRHIAPSDDFISGSEILEKLNRMTRLRLNRRKIAKSMDQMGYQQTRKVVQGSKLRGYNARFRDEMVPQRWSLDQISMS